MLSQVQLATPFGINGLSRTEEKMESKQSVKIYYHFLWSLGLGELCCKGDKGCLDDSRSVKSIFLSMGLCVLGLHFRLLPCMIAKEIISVNHIIHDHHQAKTIDKNIYALHVSHQAKQCELVLFFFPFLFFSFLTLAEALLICFPPEPGWFLSLRYCCNNLLFSSSNKLFSSNNSFTYVH